jgi:hypothetical protein
LTNANQLFLLRKEANNFDECKSAFSIKKRSKRTLMNANQLFLLRKEAN